MNIYLDIETIPTQRQDVINRITSNISSPGNIKKTESLADWELNKKPALIDEAIRKTALNGTFGEIISMAWAFNDDPVQGRIRDLKESEAVLLQDFMLVMKNKIENDLKLPIWIGHFISGFDLRFIWQRCVVNQVKPIAGFPYNAKPWSDRVFDTKIEWTGAQSYSGAGTLDALCLACGLPGKSDMDGSKVWDAIRAGQYDAVLAYNKKDVTDVRDIYQRMTFTFAN